MSYSPTDTAAVDVTMPQMGVSVAEGMLIAWHKRVGDWVAEEETICEISTDKVDTEVPSPAAGRVVEILVEVEQTVAVGTVLARIATDAQAGQAHPDERLGDPAAVPVAEQAAGGHQHGSGAAPEHPGEPANGAVQAPRAASAAAGRHVSPVVRRIAEREHVDLDLVSGSGRDGRVRKQDLLAFIAARGAGQASPPQAEPAGEAPLHIESPYREDPPSVVRPAAGAAPGPGVPPSEGAAPTAGGERLSRMRRQIAAHMVRSLQTAATCTSIVEVDMSRVEAARDGLGITYLPIVARCAIDALRRHPQLNSTIEGELIERHQAVNLGIAVSLGEEGLMVPVVHDAQELSHEGLARRIRELADGARRGTLRAEDVQGGTFTITNPGGFGTIASTPIINQPQVAILDLEAVVKRAVVLTDESGRDSIAIRPMANLCLSWDHRALDGALAAQFLSTLRGRIESWENH